MKDKKWKCKNCGKCCKHSPCNFPFQYIGEKLFCMTSPKNFYIWWNAFNWKLYLTPKRKEKNAHECRFIVQNKKTGKYSCLLFQFKEFRDKFQNSKCSHPNGEQ